MAKKFSQFDIAAAIAGDESFVGLKDGDNSQFPFADVLSYFITGLYDNFWPLSGIAALTGNSEIDGDGNTLDFINLGGFSLDVGLNNMAFTGDVISIESTNAINWEVDDGVDQTDVDIDSVSFVISTVDTHFNNTNSFNVSVDDGVDSSSLTLTPDGLDIDKFAGGSSEVMATWQIDGGAGIDLRFGIGFGSTRFDDVQFGVTTSFSVNADTTNVFSVLPTQTVVTAPFILAAYTVATLPTASSHTRGLIWVSDETAGATVAFSDGTNWRRIYDGNIVS